MSISEIVSQYQNKIQNQGFKTILDIGTGDGRYVYKRALTEPNSLVIGVDPSPNFKEFQREINRKKLLNAYLLQESVETLELPINAFDEILIILPWGSLLKKIVSLDLNFMELLSQALKNKGKLHVVFGFHTEFEKTETQRLELHNLEETGGGFLKDSLSKIPLLSLTSFQTISKRDLSKFDTTWARKLSFGQDRNYWEFELIKT